MRCGRCGFENMPGLERSGRCSGVLVVREPISVTPPRARGPRRLRRMRYRLGNALGFLRSPRRAPAGPLPGPLWAGAASVVPGLGHLLTGRGRRVRWFTAGWGGCLLAGLALYGTTPGGWLLGLAVALHAHVAADSVDLNKRLNSAWLRIGASLCLFLLLAFGLYAPVRAAAGRLVRSARSAVDAGPVRQGDLLLVHRGGARAPRRGDLVLYPIEPAGGAGYRLGGGEVMSQVIALAGDTVKIHHAEVTVTRADGRQTRYDISPLPVAGATEIVVPADHCLCLPPQYARTDHGGDAPPVSTYIQTVAMPRLTGLAGRAFMLWRPLRRARWLPRAPKEEPGG